MKKNIFVFALDDFNLDLLEAIDNAENYKFHGLLRNDEVEKQSHYDLAALIQKSEDQLNTFDSSVDAIIGYIDFPVNSMVPILSEKFGTRAASLESVLKCEHKYWSRLEQRESIDEFIPNFDIFDPFDDDALSKLKLDLPFWIKPIKSFASYLGFRINNKKDFDKHVQTIRENISKVSEPFDYLLNMVELPEQIAGIGGAYCIAEEIIGGRQCTVEGYVFNGEMHPHGIVDSIRVPHSSSFSRYQYPSQLPKPVRKQMIEVTRRLIKQIGYDNAAFNVEFFWNEKHNKLWFLEMNPRISQEHCPLFEHIHGASNHEIIVDVALNRPPTLPSRKGEFKCSAKFFVRKKGDAMVNRVPTQQELEALYEQFPGTSIVIVAQEGKRLSNIKFQDSYSYVCAIVFMGAAGQKELLNNYEHCKNELNFEFSEELF